MNPVILILTYETIKSKSSNSTRGTDNETLDKIYPDWFLEISLSLLSGKFSFKPVRRTYIPKKGKFNIDGSPKLRTLTISSPRDKIVHQATYFILNAIYDQSFFDFSYGSCPNKGTHTALKQIKHKMIGVKWCIEADIDNNFPSISHKILLSILNKRIKCSKFLSLIKNSIKTEYVENNKFHRSDRGLFQGNITSLILNNICFHKFDHYIHNLSISFFKGKYRKVNLEYRKIQYRIERIDTLTKSKNLRRNPEDIKKIKALRREFWKISSKLTHNPNFRRLYYFRYVDDFIVGIISSRRDIVEIRKKIRVFLKENLDLTLHKDKTLITHFSRKSIYFLGIFIKGQLTTK